MIKIKLWLTAAAVLVMTVSGFSAPGDERFKGANYDGYACVTVTNTNIPKLVLGTMISIF